MAKRVVTTTEFIDDLDGGKAEGTVQFSFEGQNYEIDLNKRNRAAFQKVMTPYVEAGRKTRPAARSSRSKTAQRTATRQDLGEIRTWARSNGYDVADRGRVSQEIQDAYDAAT